MTEGALVHDWMPAWVREGMRACLSAHVHKESMSTCVLEYMSTCVHEYMSTCIMSVLS